MLHLGVVALIVFPALGFILYYTILLVVEARHRKKHPVERS